MTCLSSMLLRFREWLAAARAASPRRWLEGMLCACAASLPFVALSQVFAYCAALLALWMLIRRPRSRPACPRWHWAAALVFALFCLGSLAWGAEGARGISRIHRLAILLIIPAVPMAFAGRSLQTLALGLVTGSVLSALRDCVRVPWEMAHGVKLLDTGSMTTPQFYLAALLVLLAVPARDWRLRLHRLPWAWIAALALSAFGLLVHNKRGTWLAFGLSVILLSLLRRNRRLLLAILVGGVLIASIPATRNRVMGLTDMFNPKAGDRAALWVKVAPPLLREHPWGYGYKSMRHEDLKSYYRKVQSKLDHLHNNALQVSAELGWLGGGFWAVWMVSALGSGLASVRRVAAEERSLAAGVCAAFFALLANGLVEYNFGDTEILMLFAILLGMIAHQAGAREREGDG